MGKILFLSTVAFVAYRYIARSNQRHQQLPPGAPKAVEILPPAPAVAPGLRGAASEPVPSARSIPTSSRAVEAEPVR